MTNLSNEKIEDAFATIRVKFEKRNNETGLNILDSYEEQWAGHGSISERQTAWLERQLDESWRPNGKSPPEKRRGGDTTPEPKREKVPPSAEGSDQLLDAMIRRKMAEQGMAVVDLERLSELEEVIDELKQVVKSLR